MIKILYTFVVQCSEISLLGLGIYGSESESSDDDGDKSDKDDDSVIDSENEIRVSMIEFWWCIFVIKENELLSDLFDSCRK